jgi:hypothetical protein
MLDETVTRVLELWNWAGGAIKLDGKVGVIAGY